MKIVGVILLVWVGIMLLRVVRAHVRMERLIREIQESRDGVQERIFKWVRSTFGEEHAMNGQERVLRHIEESVELGQAVGLSSEALHKLIDYVFARPPGSAEQEVAGSMVTLYAAASALKIDADVELEKELVRVHRPEVVERCRRRQLEKREVLGHPGAPLGDRTYGRLGPCAVCGEVDEHLLHHTSASAFVPSGTRASRLRASGASMLKSFSTPWEDVPYTFIDTETTGVNLAVDRVVQIGIARFEKGELVGRFSSFVDPEIPIPQEATAVHGITDQNVADAPYLRAIFEDKRVRSLIEGAQPAAYNAPFDKQFVPPFGKDWDWPWADVLSMVRTVDKYVKGKGRHKLEVSCERHGVKLSKAHDAEADAVATGKLFFKVAPKVADLLDASLGELLYWQRRAEADAWFDFNRWRATQEASKA